MGRFCAFDYSETIFFDSGGLIGPHVDYTGQSLRVDSSWLPNVFKQLIQRMIYTREICRQHDPKVMAFINCRLRAATGRRIIPKQYNPEDFIGPRAVTLLVCLKDDQGSGGATLFPVLDVRIKLKPGDVLIFFNVLDKGIRDCRTLHVGCPVTKEKTVAQLWIAEYELTSFKQKFVDYFTSFPQRKQYKIAT